MMMSFFRVALVLGAVLAVYGAAEATTRRFAIVVGNNRGAPERVHLRYAESDAGRFAQVLRELGEVHPADMALLQGSTLKSVEAAMARISGRIARIKQDPSAQAVLTFYFSGHSDGTALELGGERLDYSRVKSMLRETRADVRLAVIDACGSGAVRSKGASPAPPFSVRFRDKLKSHGEVFLTSSAANEVALESDELQASYFTHHLISGLRGAADTTSDRKVTLTEAYRYAFDRTIMSSAATLSGVHHPGYDFQLSGEGELILSFLDHTEMSLELPGDLERAVVIAIGSHSVISELTAQSGALVALPAGAYRVRARRGNKIYENDFHFEDGEHRTLGWEDFEEVEGISLVSKGSGRLRGRWQLGLSAQGSSGLADTTGPGFGMRLSLDRHRFHGFNLALVGTTSRGANGVFRENLVSMRVGWRLGWAHDSFSLSLGLEGGPGFVWQPTDAGSTGTSVMGVVGPEQRFVT